MTSPTCNSNVCLDANCSPLPVPASGAAHRILVMNHNDWSVAAVTALAGLVFGHEPACGFDLVDAGNAVAQTAPTALGAVSRHGKSEHTWGIRQRPTGTTTEELLLTSIAVIPNDELYDPKEPPQPVLIEYRYLARR
jgi:hypothetical protein